MVGITVLDANENLVNQFQFFGTVIRISEEGIGIEREDTSDIFTLPPDIRGFSIAEPGEYRLRSTGEVIVDPDILSTWTVHSSTDKRNAELQKYGAPGWKWEDAT